MVEIWLSRMHQLLVACAGLSILPAVTMSGVTITLVLKFVDIICKLLVACCLMLLCLGWYTYVQFQVPVSVPILSRLFPVVTHTSPPSLAHRPKNGYHHAMPIPKV